MNKKLKTQVLIVGAGPVGFSLACFLERYGINFRIIDKRLRNQDLKRAIAVNSTTLSTFDSLGVVKDLISQARLISKLTMYWKGKRLANVNFKHFKTPYPHFVHVYQPQTEDVLINFLKKKDVNIERGVTLDSAYEENDRVCAQLIDQNHEVETIECEYIIGCDGGNSTVRTLFNVPIDNKCYGSHFVLADVVLEWDERKRTTHYFINENGYLMVVPGPDGFHRVIGSYLGEKCPEKIILSDIQKMVDCKGPGGIKIKKLEWFATAPFGHKIAKSAGLGRMLLAGDAYHQFSPVGGINMNLGIQDAHNLAWKLAYVLKRKANIGLLESYSLERNRVVEQVLQSSFDRTLVITRSPNASQEISQQYLPNFKNRSFIRNTLPRAFSGFDISFLSKNFNLKESLVGQHIASTGLITSNQTRNFILLVNSHSKGDVSVTGWPIEIKIADVPQDQALLIRPDNYIGLHCSFHELNDELNRYFHSLHIKKEKNFEKSTVY